MATTDLYRTDRLFHPDPPNPPINQAGDNGSGGGGGGGGSGQVMYYDITDGGDPNAQSLAPDDTALAATIYEVNGAGPQFGWDPDSQSWK